MPPHRPPHRRQFIIGPRIVMPHAGWLSLPLDADGTMHLAHCPELPVTHGRGDGRSSFVLIGDAQTACTNSPTPQQVVTTALTAEEVVTASSSWFGRWLLVVDGQVHLDACGLLACLYRRTHDGAIWLSSSAGLIAGSEIGGGEECERAPRVEWEVGLDFYPAPRTGFDGVRRLMVSQVIDVLAPGQPIRPRALPSPASHVGPSDVESLYRRMTSLLSGAMLNAEQAYGELWLPLTGGLHSRLLLAAAHYAGVKRLTTYTQSYGWPKMSYADRALPPRLARAAGYRHVMIAPGETSQERLDEFDAHTGTGMRMSDRAFWAAGQWDAVPQHTGVMRGGVFEYAQCVYYRYDKPAKLPPEVERAVEGIREHWGFNHNHSGSAPHNDGIPEWYEWMLEHPDDSLDWRDRFYVEQRAGGWVADIEQALDITGTHRLLPANCHRLLAAAMSMPVELRSGSQWNIELIRRMAPQLAELPYNPRSGAVQRIARRVHWETRMLMAAHAKPLYVMQRTQRVTRRLTTGS